MVIVCWQIGGIRFLYDNVVESLERCRTSSGLGCILAHSMGLGKTLQVIAFIDVFLRCTNARCVLVIVPVNTLQNWIAEFDMWLPAAATGFSDGGQDCCGTRESDPENVQKSGMNMYCRSRQFRLHVLNESMKTNVARAKVVCECDYRRVQGNITELN